VLKAIEYKFPSMRLLTDRLIDSKYSDKYKQDRQRFEKLKNIHNGERCFLLGTGPSLKNTDISLLKKEICFGVNSLLLEDIGIKIKYYGLTGANEKCLNGIKTKNNSTLFLFRAAARMYFDLDSPMDNVIALKTNGLILKKKSIPNDIAKNVYGSGGTIIVPCLQVCHYLGFKEVYLLGCDCNYAGDAHFTEYERIPFTGSSEKKHWYKVFKAYKILKKEFEKDNRKIYNATIGGCLETFERVNLEDLRK